MTRKSFLTCEHKNVQDFTECCMDCGFNIYTTEEEYLKQLREEARGKRKVVSKEIRDLEDELGIKR